MVRPKKIPTKRTSTSKSSKDQILVRKGYKKKINREIRFLQTTTKLLIPKVIFLRLVKEIINWEVGYWGYTTFRIAPQALEALQEACEMYMVQLFEDSYMLSRHAKRVTLMVEDIKLVRRLRGNAGVTNP